MHEVFYRDWATSEDPKKLNLGAKGRVRNCVLYPEEAHATCCHWPLGVFRRSAVPVRSAVYNVFLFTLKNSRLRVRCSVLNSSFHFPHHAWPRPLETPEPPRPQQIIKHTKLLAIHHVKKTQGTVAASFGNSLIPTFESFLTWHSPFPRGYLERLGHVVGGALFTAS